MLRRTVPPLRNSELSPFQRHVKTWSNCKLCPLCEHRNKVVLSRGELPCDVLFVGESPGQSEDILGAPFMGPAGRLLDDIIDGALRMASLNIEPRLAFTNLLACIPKTEGEDGSIAKTKKLPKESVAACRPRLVEITNMARPKLIVLVGDDAFKHAYIPSGTKTAAIVHPSFILRSQDVGQVGILVQRCIVIVAGAMENVLGELER